MSAHISGQEGSLIHSADPPTAHLRSSRPAVITDVAQLAGVSHQTVSRVVNNHPSVRPQTRERVLEAMRTLNFRPSHAARSLASRRSRLLGLVGYASPHHGPAQIRLALEQASRAGGYHLLSASVTELSTSQLSGALEELRGQDVEGVLVIAPLTLPAGTLEALMGGIPCVLIDAPSGVGLPNVRIDQWQGAALATRHLLEHGHTHIAHLGGPQHWSDAQARLRGFLETMGAVRSGVVYGDWTAAGGHSAMHALLERGFDGSAVFAANDQMALGAMRAARERGWRIPHDLSVVGFDNLPESAFFEPPLTSVAQDFSALGTTGLQRLLALLQGQEAPEEVVLEPTLTLRSSVRVYSRLGGYR